MVSCQVRCKSSKKAGGGGKRQSELDKILEEIEDEDDDIEDSPTVEVPDTPVTAFLYGDSKSKGSKQKSKVSFCYYY